MTTYTKDPQAVLDFSFDWGSAKDPWLAQGETITSYALTIKHPTESPASLTKNSDSTDGKRVIYWLSGGTANTSRYSVTCQITTNQGRTDERTDFIDVRDR